MIVVDVTGTADKIKRLMNLNNITVIHICNELNITKPAVYKWLSGQSLPTIDNLVMLSDMFNCTVDDILIIERY